MQEYQGTATDSLTLSYPIDIFGQRTGAFAQWPSQGWTGWNVYWSQVAGQRLNMGGASAYIDHSDAVGSMTMETDPAGAVQWKIAYYPWGQILAQGGIRQSVVWAGLDWQINDPSIPSATREYNDGLGRWLTPDPGGVKVVKLDDPQTWNMYAYVGNNPTSRNDPSGLVVECSTDLSKKDAAACQQIINIANGRDKKGNYVNPKLHSIYDRLNTDKRTFVISNAKLGGDIAGRFDIRQLTNSGKDFTAGVINLDFSKLGAMSEPTPSTIPGFSKYQGLIGKFDLELAETFGHEGEHGVYALSHLGDAVRTQRLINDEFESLQMHNMSQFLLDVSHAEPFLHATELDAQGAEQTINLELNGIP